MLIYQLDNQYHRCNEIYLPLSKGQWKGDYYRKNITVRFDNSEYFEPYKCLPAEMIRAYPDLAGRECAVKFATITFSFGKDNKIKVSGAVNVQYTGIAPGTYVSHKVQVDIPRLEIAKSLSWYFATSPEQRNHSANHLQSLYWRFIEWGFMHFSLLLEKLDVEDQECCISDLHDTFERLAVSPYIPSEPQNVGRVAIHWMERGKDGRYSVNHYLFMERERRIFHYCEGNGVMFDEMQQSGE